MHDSDDLVKILILIITIAIISCVCIGITKNAYKQGQIDAINGKIKYQLVKQNDGSTSWKYISNE